MSRSATPFSELLDACRHAAVHLEMRDAYGVEDEDADFAAWQAGHRHDPDDRASWWNEFHQQIADAVARGVVVRRARIVSEPLAPYIRFEYDSTFQNIAAGEEVRWLPRRLASDLLIPGNDLWIFDRSVIRFGLFAGDGRFIENILSEDPDTAARHSAAFEQVWQRAIPHAAYKS